MRENGQIVLPKTEFVGSCRGGDSLTKSYYVRGDFGGFYSTISDWNIKHGFTLKMKHPTRER